MGGWESIPECEAPPDSQSQKRKSSPRKHNPVGAEALPGLSRERQAVGQTPWTQKPKAQPFVRASEQCLQPVLGSKAGPPARPPSNSSPPRMLPPGREGGKHPPLDCTNI